MKTGLKIIGGVVILIVAVLCIGLLVITKTYPKVDPAPDLKVELSPENIERGRYLANTVCVCMDCHSTRDWSSFSGPLIEGTLGKGGEKFSQDFGFPGEYYAPNITPSKLKEWTDGEIYRAITSGVSKDGHALFPVMPYPAFGQMDPSDIKAIIAYLRTIPEQVHEVPASKSDFPMNFIIRTIPSNAPGGKMPPQTDKIAYGGYLFKAASCADCHTPFEKGQPLMEQMLAGGREFPMPAGMLRSPNISPDKETGIGEWTEERFVQRFKAYAAEGYVPPKVGMKDFNSIMPWTMYANMTEEDLKAIYAFIKAQKPMKNEVETFTPLAVK